MALTPPDSMETSSQMPHSHSESIPGSEPELVEAHEDEKPTASHQLADLATADQPTDAGEPEEKGVAQIEHGDIEVKNLGWNEKPDVVPEPLVGGLDNEDLWALIRRFNKQVFYVKSIEEPPLADLDLNIADDEEFSPDKLRAHMERLYMTIVVGLFAFGKHIVRLRSWREWRRTLAFLSVYAVAWIFDYLVPVIVGFLIVLIISPRARTYCFPPAPPALIDSKTGGVKKPAAGVLASEDSITGAPEKHAGEAVEQEAHSFVNSISTLIVSTAAGKHPQGDPHQDTAAPDPTNIAEDVADAKDKTGGDMPTAQYDKTKKPVSETVWNQARPAMHAISNIVDTWERFGNALSPTAPFPRRRPRLTLAAALLPIMLGSCFLTSYMIVKGTGFFVGFGFFADPIIQRGIAFINRTYPRWEKYVELRHTLLRGIPTNAQLTLTLLRIGERNKAPLPPPPADGKPPPLEANESAGQGLEYLGATDEELAAAIQPSESDHAADAEAAAKSQKKPSKFLSFIKGTAKGSIHTALGADKIKAAAGARHAKDRLGVVKSGPNPVTGPIRFPARFKGQKGHAYITATATTPALSWTTSIEDLNPAWTVAIGEIDEIRKVGGLGWKSKIVVGWAMEREVADGIVVTSKTGKEWHLTALGMRDELFNRLVAMGSQMWEAW